MASDMNRLKRQLFLTSSLLPGIIVTVLQVTMCSNIFEIGSPPDPWKNHNIARRSRHSGTGVWFIQGDTLSEWRASGPLLWIHGKRELPPSAYSFAKTDGFPL